MLPAASMVPGCALLCNHARPTVKIAADLTPSLPYIACVCIHGDVMLRLLKYRPTRGVCTITGRQTINVVYESGNL